MQRLTMKSLRIESGGRAFSPDADAFLPDVRVFSPDTLAFLSSLHFWPDIFKYLIVSVLSLLLVGCKSAAPAVKRTAAATASEATVWTSEQRSETEKNSYRVVLKTPKNSITGICMLKKAGDEWRGTLINEFGAKAFDFIITDKKCELLHVISMMDKWYIKKTVAADLYYLFNVDHPNAPFRKKLERFEQDGTLVVNYKKKQILVEPDGAISLKNNRRNLQYELRKMGELDPDKIIL